VRKIGAMHPLRRYGALRSMSEYARTIGRGKPAFVRSWYSDAICEHLDLAVRTAMGRKDGLDAVAIFMPPRHGKTMLCSELLPSYVLARRPSAEIISLTYSVDLARDSRKAVAEIMESDRYRAICSTRVGAGDVEEVDERGRVRTRRAQAEMSANVLRTLRATPAGLVEPGNGLYLSTSLGGKCTGKGANLMVFDDLVKNAGEASSPSKRRQVEGEIERTAFTRMYRDSAQVLLMTRWHELDAGGFIVRKWEEAGLRYAVLTIRAEREEEDLPYDPRSPGDFLDSVRFGDEWYRQRKILAGIDGWGCLYQQRPTAKGGRPFPRGRWGRYEPEMLGRTDLSLLEGVALSIDANLTEGGGSYAQIDEWGLVQWPSVSWGGRGRKEAWKLGEARGQWAFPDLLASVRAALEKWRRLGSPVKWILIEDKATGPALQATLEAEGVDAEIVRCKTGSLSKETRGALVEHLFAQGQVQVPFRAWGPVSLDWVEPHLQEWEDFPQGKNDDRVDTGVQFLRWASEHQGLIDQAPEPHED
jgi:hypothetical protein